MRYIGFTRMNNIQQRTDPILSYPVVFFVRIQNNGISRPGNVYGYVHMKTGNHAKIKSFFKRLGSELGFFVAE